MENQTQYPIRLSDFEKELLINKLKVCEHYLEFGSGGSTFLAILEGNCKKIVSVESDSKWIEYLRTFETIKQAEKNILSFEYINIGEVGDWGTPLEENKKELFPNYSSKVFNGTNNYDLVFIDGRFRVACTMQTILNCGNDVTIIMHDYNNRPQYHCILEFLNIIYTLDTMAVFKIKPDADKEKVIQRYEEYKYNFA